MTTNRFTITDVDIQDVDGIECVAGLHMELLDFGPLAGLGHRFIRDIGYKLHMEDGLLNVALCRVDGIPAGFVSYTARSLSFHRQSLKSHLFRVCWVLTLSLLRKPARVVNLVRVVKVMFSRRTEQRRGEDPLGEVVSIAVRRKFLGGEYVNEKNQRISAALVDYARERLASDDVDQMRMLVDADNKGALFMYHGLGARMDAYEQGGEPMVEVWFDLSSAATGNGAEDAQ